ncbi:MAG: YjgN family protein [Pseudomonadota bacterium]
MNEATSLDGGASIAAPVAATPARKLFPFEFRGNGGEYFRIWIVNLLLTIITLGIYSAWAKVRRLRYFYGNTLLDGHSFEYHGRPLAILKGRLIVVGLYFGFLLLAQVMPLVVLVFLPLIIFGLPWIVMRSRLFQLRMSSYRNLRFNFAGSYGGAMGAFVGWYLLTVITFGILYPAWVRKRVQYTLDNSLYGTQPFEFKTGNGEYFKFCYITAGLSLLAYIVGAFALFGLTAIKDVFTSGIPPTGLQMLSALGVGGFLLILVAAIAGFSIAAYYQASFINASFGGVEIGSNSVLSDLKVAPLMWIYVTNLLGIVFTLGLFYPWAKVRQTRYQLENMQVDSDGNLGAFTAGATGATSAVGEEAGDFFDVDFGL